MKECKFIGLALVLAAFAVLTTAEAQTKTQDIVIHVDDLDCEACAVVVEYSLEEVAGVGKIKIDVDSQTVTVTPKAKKRLRPS